MNGVRDSLSRPFVLSHSEVLWGNTRSRGDSFQTPDKKTKFRMH
jgi:hypothetical protein